ncbi:MAG: mitofilin family membrane protein [Rhizomicrobium sp.]
MPEAREAGALAPIALRGAPTQATLAARFPSMAAKALAAEKAAQASTWLGRLWANITNVIVVRRIGDVAGQDSDSILARAGTRLDSGDLDGAVREMKGLKGAARTSAQAWLGAAEARLAIARATRALAHRLALLLAAP